MRAQVPEPDRCAFCKSSCLKGLKCALSCLGICSDFLAEPFHRLREPQRKIIIQRLQKIGIVPVD